MPWGRIDDSMYDHPKVEALPARTRNACVGLWIRAISYSNRHMTDGFVSDDKLRRLDARATEIEALVAVGLFDRLVDGIRIHDFLDFNDSASTVRKRRSEMRELGKRGGQARRFITSGSATLELPSRPLPSVTNNPPTPLVDKSKKSDA
jgi:hypothetical protein